MTAAQQEKERLAHRELVAARRIWIREFRHTRKTLMCENLLPVAQRMDLVFKRFVRASRPLAEEVRGLRTRRA